MGMSWVQLSRKVVFSVGVSSPAPQVRLLYWV